MDRGSVKSLLKQTYEEWSDDQIPPRFRPAYLGGLALGFMTGLVSARLRARSRH